MHTYRARAGRSWHLRDGQLVASSCWFIQTAAGAVRVRQLGEFAKALVARAEGLRRENITIIVL